MNVFPPGAAQKSPISFAELHVSQPGDLLACGVHEIAAPVPVYRVLAEGWSVDQNAVRNLRENTVLDLLGTQVVSELLEVVLERVDADDRGRGGVIVLEQRFRRLLAISRQIALNKPFRVAVAYRQRWHSPLGKLRLLAKKRAEHCVDESRSGFFGKWPTQFDGFMNRGPVRNPEKLKLVESHAQNRGNHGIETVKRPSGQRLDVIIEPELVAQNSMNELEGKPPVGRFQCNKTPVVVELIKPSARMQDSLEKINGHQTGRAARSAGGDTDCGFLA